VYDDEIDDGDGDDDDDDDNDMMYLLTTIGLSPDGSSAVHI
jgi:hypothetical protein